MILLQSEVFCSVIVGNVLNKCFEGFHIVGIESVLYHIAEQPAEDAAEVFVPWIREEGA